MNSKKQPPFAVALKVPLESQKRHFFRTYPVIFLNILTVVVALLLPLVMYGCAKSHHRNDETAHLISDIRWGIVNKRGVVQLWDPDIIALAGVSEGFVPYMTNTRKEHGVINLKGQRFVLGDWLVSANTRFVNGVAPVQARVASSSQPEYYFVDHQGRKKIKQPFYSAKPFSDGLAAVLMAPNAMDRPCQKQTSQSAMWGYINIDGIIVIRPRFANASNFIANRAVVDLCTRDHIKAIIDRNGKEVFSANRLEGLNDFDKQGLAPFDNLHRLTPDLPECGLLDTKGKVHASGVSFLNFSEGMGLLRCNNTEMSFADSTGKVVLRWPHRLLAWSRTEPIFSEGLVAVPIAEYKTIGIPYRGYEIENVGAVYGFADKTGHLLSIDLPGSRQIINAFPFSEGYAVVQTAILQVAHSHK